MFTIKSVNKIENCYSVIKNLKIHFAILYSIIYYYSKRTVYFFDEEVQGSLSITQQINLYLQYSVRWLLTVFGNKSHYKLIDKNNYFSYWLPSNNRLITFQLPSLITLQLHSGSPRATHHRVSFDILIFVYFSNLSKSTQVLENYKLTV